MIYQLIFILTMVFCSSEFITAAPSRNIPPDLLSSYTLNGQIPMQNWYLDGTYSKPLVFTKEDFNNNIAKALKRETNYYGQTDTHLYHALDDLAKDIRGKEVGIIGSTAPWYESIILSYGATPVVIEYNPIKSEDQRVTYMTPEQFKKNPKKFDLLLSISSVNHDGLGRYGDTLNPNGDLESMKNFQTMLNPNGKLLLAIPVGPDKLYWNAHRVYGPLRLKMLLKGWKVDKYYGFNIEQLTTGIGYLPLFLLEVNNK